MTTLHPEPENARKTIREPTDEKGTDKAEQAVEHRDRLGNDQGERPHAKSHQNPDESRDLGTANNVLGVAEDASKDVLASNVSVDDTCDDNRGNGNAPNGLAHNERARSGESRRWNIGSDVDINNDSRYQVQASIDDLQQSKGFGPLVWVLELSNDTKEARMARWTRLEVDELTEVYFRHLQNATAMLVTAKNALVNGTARATWMDAEPIGRLTATSPTVIRVAIVMDKQADIVSTI